eukprot:CAMPEP_0185030436 /NCGR_PEP_ID=MMETSP1103-20130426/17406_1 /TAXON_ID=36769 /ORGANISM="Paraphysomonas bandaiensis, Strain Caron Lab Isolate" /LENGTH=646 /DNA_ID=CAMNT_0027565573 /DNA_START=216 /DNA_END=2154 /DNA_ORIENTATION=+
MPQCKHGKSCKIKNCPLKHEDEEERAECIFFRQGFCMHGPVCKFRHIKRPPDECPSVATFDQYVASGNVPLSKKRKTHQPNQFYKITLCKHWLEHGNCPFGEECHYAHGEADLKMVAGQGEGESQGDEGYDPLKGRMDAVLDLPYNSTTKAAYFLMHAPDLATLQRARVRGYWGTSLRIAHEMNDAVRTFEWVVIFFTVRGLKGVYGVASVPTMIPIVPSPYSPLVVEFPVRWMRTVRMSMRMLSHLKMVSGGSTNVGRSNFDGRIDKNAGYEILLIAYRKPEWDWHADIERASCTISDNGTLTAVSPPAPPSPDPTILFSMQWIQQAFSGGHGRGDDARGRGGPRNHHAPPGDAAGGGGDYYGGNLPGFVVGCTPQMMQECFARSLFGLPANRRGDAQQGIRQGTPLFLQDLGSGMLYGLFEAVSPPLDNAEPSAWAGRDRGAMTPLPVQVRFRIVLRAPPLQPMDPEAAQVFSNRPPADRIGPISLGQTKVLSNMFAARAGVWNPPVGGGGGPPHRPPHQQGAGGGRGGPQSGLFYKPPFKFSQNVPVNIPFTGDGFGVRKRLLGPQASKIHAVVNEFGSQQTIKVRLRGIGSGFREGPNREEAPEPLHFVVSVNEEQLLQPVCASVQKVIDSARSEYMSSRDK